MHKSRDPGALADSLSAWIREQVERAGSTGVVFGLLPAVKAALLNPIDALRHE